MSVFSIQSLTGGKLSLALDFRLMENSEHAQEPPVFRIGNHAPDAFHPVYDGWFLTERFIS